MAISGGDFVLAFAKFVDAMYPSNSLKKVVVDHDTFMNIYAEMEYRKVKSSKQHVFIKTTKPMSLMLMGVVIEEAV